jgi:AraC family transcriptional regulator of adaptative response / DNA-3-methyladenine glycosylase II
MKIAKKKNLSSQRHCAECVEDSKEVLDALQLLVAEIRTQPGDFCDVRSIVARSGLGVARVADLFRRHYHATPYDVLKRARLEAAKRLLLASELSAAHVAQLLGDQSADVFESEFSVSNGLSPEAYRKLGTGQVFEVRLPVNYPLGYLRKALGRDKHSVTERLIGDEYTTAIRLGEEALLVSLTLGEGRVRVATAQTTAHLPRVHAMVIGLLGLEQRTSEFAALVKRLGLESLIGGRPNLRIVQTPSIFDGLLWTIIGQQINIAVFIDGCFWHGCPEHYAPPKSHSQYWLSKIEGNMLRDADTNRLLLAKGWVVLRFWSHEDPDAVAEQIALQLRAK